MSKNEKTIMYIVISLALLGGYYYWKMQQRLKDLRKGTKITTAAATASTSVAADSANVIPPTPPTTAPTTGLGVNVPIQPPISIPQAPVLNGGSYSPGVLQ